MTEQPNQPPAAELPPEQVNQQTPPPLPENGNRETPLPPPPAEEPPEAMHARLERLGGEPAPDISPEEFARLQQSGQIHIDPRGRVRSSQNVPPDDPGISLRKRRAWYSRA
jgi:hypothetical protein